MAERPDGGEEKAVERGTEASEEKKEGKDKEGEQGTWLRTKMRAVRVNGGKGRRGREEVAAEEEQGKEQVGDEPMEEVVTLNAECEGIKRVYLAALARIEARAPLLPLPCGVRGGRH